MAKSNAGRKPIQIDKMKFEDFCADQATCAEIAAHFDIEEETLNAWCKRTYGSNFSGIFAKKRLKGYMSLRRRLRHKAVVEGDTKVLLHLSEHWLGHVKKTETKHDVTTHNTPDESLNRLAQIINGIAAANK